MPKVVAVSFPFATRALWFSPEKLDVLADDLVEGTEVICKTARGEEFGIVDGAPFEVTEEKLKEVLGEAQLSDIVRLATGADSSHHDELVEKAFSKLPFFRDAVKELKLPIKPVGIEYVLDGKTAICFFAAEERVDFRELVKKLARELDAKIDMRQIGVREEAAAIGGYAQCGQQLCCARWETGFAPISIRMAKEQDLPLNSPKISGVCGRLMCCLRYEFDAYKEFKKRAPKVGASIETPLGMAKVTALDTPRELVRLKIEDEATFDIPLEFLTCLTKEGKPAAARPNTLTQENLERFEAYEAEKSAAQSEMQSSFGFALKSSSTGMGERVVNISVNEPVTSGNLGGLGASALADRASSNGLSQEDDLLSREKREGKKRSRKEAKQKKNKDKNKKRRNQRGAAQRSWQSTQDQQETAMPQHAKRRRRPGDKGRLSSNNLSGGADRSNAGTLNNDRSVKGGATPASSTRHRIPRNNNAPSSSNQAAKQEGQTPLGITRRRRHHR